MNIKKSFNWNLFLNQFSRDLLERLEDNEFASLPSEVIDSKWLGYSGATDAEISALETHLEKTLPPSYKSFLAISNGWRKLEKNDLIDRLFPIEEVDRLPSKNQELIDGWLEGFEIGVRFTPVPPVTSEEYFVYGSEQESTSLRNEYLPHTIEIGGNPEQGLLLLNPQVVFNNDEWETWHFAFWLPGARRYKSFIDFMQRLHSQLLDNHLKLRELSS